MDDMEKYKQRLEAIAEKRRLQEEQERARREMEEEKLRLQQLKRKSLRDQWLMDGAPLSPTSPDAQSPRPPLWSSQVQTNEIDRLQSDSLKPMALAGGTLDEQMGNGKAEDVKVAAEGVGMFEGELKTNQTAAPGEGGYVLTNGRDLKHQEASEETTESVVGVKLEPGSSLVVCESPLDEEQDFMKEEEDSFSEEKESGNEEEDSINEEKESSKEEEDFTREEEDSVCEEKDFTNRETDFIKEEGDVKEEEDFTKEEEDSVCEEKDFTKEEGDVKEDVTKEENDSSDDEAETLVMRAECVIVTDEGDEEETNRKSVEIAETNPEAAEETGAQSDIDGSTHPQADEEAEELLLSSADALEGALEAPVPPVAQVPTYPESQPSSPPPPDESAAQAEAAASSSTHSSATTATGHFQEVPLSDNHRTEEEPLLSQVKGHNSQAEAAAGTHIPARATGEKDADMPKQKSCQCCSLM